MKDIGETQIISDVNKMEEELDCDKCESPISNFFITASEKKYVCLRCGKQQQKGYHRGPVIQVHYRLFDIATAERIVDKVTKKINGGTTCTASITNLLNAEEVEIIGKC